MKLTGWGRTDTGRKREHNEDSYLVDGGSRLFAVADGMGGHRGGATASRMAMEVLQRHVAASVEDLAGAAETIEAESFLGMASTDVMRQDEMETAPTRRQRGGRARAGRPRTPRHVPQCDGTEPTIEFSAPPAITVMRAAAEEASFQIFEAALADPNLRGMGTTLTAMLYDGGRMHLVHAGDSRAYLFRNGKLSQLTEDHSWIAEQIKCGLMTLEEARESKYRHVITRSVGFERQVELDTCGVAVEAGDCFVLCSDGVCNHVENDEIERILASTWFRQAPEQLIALANERGGDDNITVVVVHAANHAG